MTINFSCEICGKTLSTSDDKAGRKAKCPGCGEMLIVPNPDGTSPNDLPGDEATSAATSSHSEKIPCPMCGEDVPASAKQCEFCGEPLKGTRRSDSPQTIEIGDVISTGWNVFKSDMGTALGVVIVAILIMAVASVPQSVLSAIADVTQRQGDQQTALVLRLVSLLFLPVAYAVQFYIGCGQASALLKIARGENADIGELFRGGRFFWRNTGASIIFLLMFGFGCVFCLIPGLIVWAMFWPYLFVLVDEDPSGVDCLGRAYTLTAGNRLAGFLLILVSIGLYLAGFMALCIGVFFTVPLLMVMWAVAYCRMTGQRVAA